MSQLHEQFKVGDRVCYTRFYPREYGIITKITLEVPESETVGVGVCVYEIAMEAGGTFTGLSKNLRRAPRE